jgi:hypothetical protein
MEVDKQVKQLLQDGIIEESNSPWSSPILAIPNMEASGQQKFRLVVDYRELNEKKTVENAYPFRI